MKTFLKQYLFAILFISIGIFTKSYATSFHFYSDNATGVLCHIVPQREHDTKIFAEAIDIEFQEEEANTSKAYYTAVFSEFIFGNALVLSAMSNEQSIKLVNVQRLPLRVPSAVLAKLQVFII